ncbi:Peroxidase [Rhynchospora pubera]|uniref:Peroxidase n=1 Tax=Rhynchospora pubera TaxID=906938 RepID=A0AAV8EE28_9POAL|nr:Peroxidase [Rhynchospora pubera]
MEVALVSLLILSILHLGSGLSLNYYDKTCPNYEATVTAAVKQAMATDNTVPAALLRLHFHDCFVRGCDGSVLLDSTSNNTAEKTGPPNVSLHAFYVIDNAKSAIEAQCPGVVSCADILALAARDAVALSGGPTWKVPVGRLDGRISKASETSLLPAPTSNFAQLQQRFNQLNLSVKDLVTLSGGHTLGFAHCSSFQNRIHSFNSVNDIDPTLSPSFASLLRKACPGNNTVQNAGATLDATSKVFDNMYYKMLLNGMSLFSSDAALLTHPKTKGFVTTFANSQEAFNLAFVKSMLRMSSLTGGQEVRLNCRKVR